MCWIESTNWRIQMTTKQVKKATAKTTTKKVTAKKSATTAKTSNLNVSEQAASVFETLKSNFVNAQETAQKVWFASLGAMGRSVDEVQNRYEQANEGIQTRYSKINEDGQKLVADLVQRGEKVQDDAEVLLKESRANIEEQIEVARGRLSGLVSVTDIPARLQDMSDKLEALSKDLKKSA